MPDKKVRLLDKKKKKIVLSPHYDDFILSLGGIALRWAKAKCDVEDWIIFSKCTFALDEVKNPDYKSSERIKKISELRFNEELEATKKLGNVNIKLCNLDECIIRGHEIDKVVGPNLFKDNIDRKTVEEINKLIKPLLLSEHTQIFVPLAVRSHIDHIIVRNVVINSLIMLKEEIKAEVFFYEDLPYAASADKDEVKEMDHFIASNKLLPITYPIKLRSKMKMLDVYKSQMEDFYYKYVAQRAEHLQKQNRLDLPCERVFLFMPERLQGRLRIYPLKETSILKRLIKSKRLKRLFMGLFDASVS